MEHERAFHEAIAEQPDDDLHRLAWADWLDDHGQHDRAAFVRAQLRLATLADDDLARDPVEDEADDLLAVHEADWAGRLADLTLEWQWRRGCIEQVTVWADTLLEHSKELFALAPIREVRLLGNAASLARVAGCEVLQRVEALDLARGPGGRNRSLPLAYHRDQDLMVLLTSPHLKRLKSLDLSDQGIEGRALQALIDARAMQRLVRLDLQGCRAIGDRAVRILAGTGAGRFEALDLRATNVTAAGLRALLSAAGLPQLSDVAFLLNLLFPRLTMADEVERELSASPRLARLKSIYLSGAIEPRHLTFTFNLLGALPAGQVRRLWLWKHKLSVDQVERLMECPSLEGLQELQLHETGLRDGGAGILTGARALSHLTRLNLGSNPIGGPGIRALLESPTLARMRELTLWRNYVGTAGAQIIAGTARQRRLTSLDLNSTNLDAESARILAGSEALSRLRRLVLGSNNLTDEGARALATSPHLRRLRVLDVSRNDIVSPDTESLLRERFGTGLHL